MQIEDYLYEKDLYLPLGRKIYKPKEMSDSEWKILERNALGMIRLSLASMVAFNVSREKTTKDLIAALSKMYEKPSASNKVFLMKLFNLKMADNESISGHLNELNTLTSQLELVEINFEDEIRALVLLFSLPKGWDGLVMAVRNSCGTETLKFDDVVGVLLSKEARTKSSGSAETSRSALSVDRKGRSENRDKKKMRGQNPNREEVYPSQGVLDVGGVVRWGIFKRTASRRIEKTKARRRIPLMSRREMDMMP